MAKLATDRRFVADLYADPWSVIAHYELDHRDVDAVVAFLRQRASVCSEGAARRRAAAEIFGLLAKLRHPSAAGAIGE